MREYGGTGLGLAISKRLVEVMGADRGSDRLDLLSQRAHKVKGGCLALGAEAMAEVAEWLQRNATSADRGLVMEQVEETQRHFEVVRKLLGVEHPSLLPPPNESPSTAPSP